MSIAFRVGVVMSALAVAGGAIAQSKPSQKVAGEQEKEQGSTQDMDALVELLFATMLAEKMTDAEAPAEAKVPLDSTASYTREDEKCNLLVHSLSKWEPEIQSIEGLLKKGANPNCKGRDLNDRPTMPIDRAIDIEAAGRVTGAVRLMIESGADLEDCQAEGRCSPYIAAADPQLLRFLANAGLDLEATLLYGERSANALEHAILGRNLEKAENLAALRPSVALVYVEDLIEECNVSEEKSNVRKVVRILLGHEIIDFNSEYKGANFYDYLERRLTESRHSGFAYILTELQDRRIAKLLESE